MRHYMPNVVQIGQTIAGISPAFGDLYHCAKFGWNRCSSFENMDVFLFLVFGLKTPIHAPKLRVLGFLTP